jgi:hypothetical protein
MDQEDLMPDRQPCLDPVAQFGAVSVTGVKVKRPDPGAHREFLALDAHRFRAVLQDAPHCAHRLKAGEQNGASSRQSQFFSRCRMRPASHMPEAAMTM